jgi:CRP-like cAMP-binding protein
MDVRKGGGAVIQPSFNFDISKGRHVSTSKTAHARVKPFKLTLHNRIRELLSRTPDGMTAKEIGDAVGIAQVSASGRCAELKALGIVVRTGDLRDGAYVLKVAE